jgi:hypothetical protein
MQVDLISFIRINKKINSVNEFPKNLDFVKSAILHSSNTRLKCELEVPFRGGVGEQFFGVIKNKLDRFWVFEHFENVFGLILIKVGKLGYGLIPAPCSRGELVGTRVDSIASLMQ